MVSYSSTCANNSCSLFLLLKNGTENNNSANFVKQSKQKTFFLCWHEGTSDATTEKLYSEWYLWVCCCCKHSRLQFCPSEKTVFINFATTTNNSSLASSSSSERAQQHWQQPRLARIYCNTRNLREGRGIQRFFSAEVKKNGSEREEASV